MDLNRVQNSCLTTSEKHSPIRTTLLVIVSSTSRSISKNSKNQSGVGFSRTIDLTNSTTPSNVVGSFEFPHSATHIYTVEGNEWEELYTLIMSKLLTMIVLNSQTVEEFIVLWWICKGGVDRACILVTSGYWKLGCELWGDSKFESRIPHLCVIRDLKFVQR